MGSKYRILEVDGLKACISFHNDTIKATVIEIAEVCKNLKYSSSLDNKSKYSWYATLEDVETGVKIPFSIYDYKYCDYIYFDRAIDWHIGAASKEDSAIIKSFVEASLSTLRTQNL